MLMIGKMNIKIKKYLFFVILFVLLYGCSQEPQLSYTIIQSSLDKTTITDVVRQIKHFDNLLQKGMIEYKRISYEYCKGDLEEMSITEIRHTFDQSKAIETQRIQYVKQPKIKQPIDQRRTIFVDGQNGWLWTYDVKRPEGMEEGSDIYMRRYGVGVSAEHKDLLYRKNPLQEYYIRCIGECIDENHISMSEIIDSEGNHLYKIESKVKENRVMSYDWIEYIVDPQKQFLPKEILLYDYNDKNKPVLYERILVMSYIKDDQENWFPSKMMVWFKEDYKDIFEFYRVKFNCDVVIDLTLPSGVYVCDDRKKPSPFIEYETLVPVNYTELQDPAVAEKEGKIRINQSPK